MSHDFCLCGVCLFGRFGNLCMFYALKSSSYYKNYLLFADTEAQTDNNTAHPTNSLASGSLSCSNILSTSAVTTTVTETITRWISPSSPSASLASSLSFDVLPVHVIDTTKDVRSVVNTVSVATTRNSPAVMIPVNSAAGASERKLQGTIITNYSDLVLIQPKM